MRRFLLRCLLAVAFINLGWDLLDAADRLAAGHARSLYRWREGPDARASGFVQVSVVNETEGEVVVESLVAGERGGGGSHTSGSVASRTPSPPPNAFSVQDYHARLSRVVERGSLTLRRSPDGSEETVALDFGRRAPAHCRVEVRVRPDGARASPCELWDPRDGPFYWYHFFWFPP